MNANLGMVAMGAAEMTTTTEFTEADLLAAKPERTPDETKDEYVMRWVFAAVAARRKKIAEQEQEAWEGGERWEPLAYHLCADENGEDACNDLIFEGSPVPEPWGERWLKYEDEAKRMIALVDKYAAPMPQANESEAVKALRRVVSNYETNCSVRDAWAWHEDSYNAARAVLAGEPGAQEKGHDE